MWKSEIYDRTLIDGSYTDGLLHHIKGSAKYDENPQKPFIQIQNALWFYWLLNLRFKIKRSWRSAIVEVKLSYFADVPILD